MNILKMTYAQLADQMGMNRTNLGKMRLRGSDVPTQAEAVAFVAARVKPSGAWTAEKANRAAALLEQLTGEAGESKRETNQLANRPPRESKPSPRVNRHAPESLPVQVVESATVIESHETHESSPAPVESAPAANRDKTIRRLLTTVIFADLLMVVVGMWLLLGVVGLMVAVMVVSSIYAAKELSSQEGTLQTAGTAVFVSFLLSVGGAFLHYNTLANELNLDTVRIGSQVVVCWTIAVTISGLSFAALLITRNLTAEKMFQ